MYIDAGHSYGHNGIFTLMLYITEHNRSYDPMPELEFRIYLVTSDLTKYGTKPKDAGRPSSSKVVVDIRYDKIDHLLTYIPYKKRRRFADECCSSYVRTTGCKCNVGVCIKCNIDFHLQ